MFISTSLPVISIRVAFLLTGRAILHGQRQPRLHLVMEHIYFRRRTTTALNYTLHPTEEPTHDGQANLWRKLHHTFVCSKCLQQFLVYVDKILQGDVKKQRTGLSCANLEKIAGRTKSHEAQDAQTTGLL